MVRCSFFLTALPLWAADTAPGPRPISITSKTMTVKNLENLAIFDGEVVMIQDDVTITSDHAEVSFVSKGPAQGDTKSGLLSTESPLGANEISLIHAWGNVILTQGEKRAESKEVFYYHQEDRVVLTGDPIFWEKEYRVTGIRMTLYLRENRSVIEGSKVMINPSAATGEVLR